MPKPVAVTSPAHPGTPATVTRPARPALSPKSCRVLNEMAEFTAAALERGGIPCSESRRLADGVVNALSENMGGSLVYLPRNLAARTASRDAQIFAEYQHTPDSIADLARRYGLSEIHVYRIVERQRQLRLAAIPH